MGCASSNFTSNCNESIYEASLQDRSKPCKRSFSKRVGCTDSSVPGNDESNNASKFWSSTSNWSQCSTPPPTPTKADQPKKLKLKRSMFSKLSARHMPKALAKLTLGDKSKAETESPAAQQQQQRQYLEQSNGYFSASTDNFESSANSSFEKPSLLLCTQNIDSTTNTSTNTTNCSYETAESDLNEPVSNLKMEILMLRDNRQLMPKTSSPYCARSDAFACSGKASYTGTYRRWIQYLEDTPAYMFKDITAIPEAISGQFSPDNHPAYTNIWNSDCVSAAKRYRYEHHAPASSNVPLDLVVSGAPGSALVSTEL